MTEQMDMFNHAPRSHSNPLVDILKTESEFYEGTRWFNARDLYCRLPVMTFEQARRQLRQWAEDSDGLVISGNNGYCLIHTATPEERTQAARRLISQGRLMHKRGIRILRKQHQIEGA